MSEGRHQKLDSVLGIAVLVVLLCAYGTVGSAAAVSYPVLPAAEEGKFLSNLTLPPLAPGSSGSLTWQLSNPMPSPLTGISLSFELYAYNAYTGGAVGGLPAGAIPQLSLTGGSGSSVNFTSSSLSHGATESSPIAVSVPAGTPLGDYAVRTSLTFTANGTQYRLESRGYFSAAQWSYATNGSSAPTGHPTLNVSRLNVSAVLPETAVTVLDTSGPTWIYGLLAAAIVAAGIGGYYSVARRRGPTSGARTPPDPTRAERALGKREKSDGD